MTKLDQNVTIWEGEYKELPFTVVDGDGVAVNLTGAALTYKLSRDGPTDIALLAKTIGDGITLTNAAGGAGTIVLASVDTVTFGGQSYYHELVITDPDGHDEVGFIGRVRIHASLVL